MNRTHHDATAIIREYQAQDAAALRICVVALQESERAIDPALPPGEAMADRYRAHLHERCRAADGRIFVAERDGTVAGFVAVLAREPFTEPDDPSGVYALIADLVVLPAYRRQGIGRRLLDRAQAYATSAGARELRIQVLAGNEAARRMYRDAGFVPHLEILTKPLPRGAAE